MTPLTAQAHDILRRTVQPGEAAIDATAGNGHDTLFLAELVGPAGLVIACDLQAAAIQHTAALLASRGICHVQLCQQDHAQLLELVPPHLHGHIAAAMFNLGYLPGGDKSQTTQPASTVPAIMAALGVLRVGGVLTVLAYIGHPGGAEEACQVHQLLASLSPQTWEYEELAGHGDARHAPRLFVIRKQQQCLA